VKPHLWCPTTLTVNKPLIAADSALRTPTELAARIVAEAAALQPQATTTTTTTTNSQDLADEARRPSLALFRGLKGFKGQEDAPAHFEDLEGEEHILRITFKEGVMIVAQIYVSFSFQCSNPPPTRPPPPSELWFNHCEWRW
jgi:hypothetical protein